MKIFTCSVILMLFSTGLYTTQEKKTLGIRLQSPTGNNADATIYFDQGISPDYDKTQDAQMVYNPMIAYPSLYSLTSDQVACSVNGCGDLSTTTIIPLGYHVGYAGTYNITAMLINNFDVTSLIQLEDRLLGKTIDLRENFYQVQLDSNGYDESRFYIHVSTAVIFNSTPSNCANTGGQISVSMDTSINWNTCQLFDANNVMVASKNSVTGMFTFDSLAAGNYQVVFVYNLYSATHNFQLNGNFVAVSIGAPSATIYADQNVIFNAITSNASQYTWDFGDGSTATGVQDAPQTYFTPGDYTIHLACANKLGCTATAETQVTVALASGVNTLTDKDVNIIAYNNSVIINMNGALNGTAEIIVYNLLGQPVVTRLLETEKETFDLSGQLSGYYFVTVKNAGKTSSKRIFLSQ